MMIFWIVWSLAVIFLLVSGVVLLFGAPYMPTLKQQQAQALQLLALKPGQVVYDLGCGDGRFLIAAAEGGLMAIGYEINPFIWFVAWIRTRRYGRLIKVRLRSFWRADLSPADGVFVFLLDRFMPRLDDKLRTELHPGAKLVSHAFKIPGKKPAKKLGPMFLYRY